MTGAPALRLLALCISPLLMCCSLDTTGPAARQAVTESAREHAKHPDADGSAAPQTLRLSVGRRLGIKPGVSFDVSRFGFIVGEVTVRQAWEDHSLAEFTPFFKLVSDPGSFELINVPAIEATVKSLDDEKGEVVLSAGSEHGVKIGMRFYLSRDGAYLGEAQVVKVRSKESTCRLENLRLKAEIAPGDAANTR